MANGLRSNRAQPNGPANESLLVTVGAARRLVRALGLSPMRRFVAWTAIVLGAMILARAIVIALADRRYSVRGEPRCSRQSRPCTASLSFSAATMGSSFRFAWAHWQSKLVAAC